MAGSIEKRGKNSYRLIVCHGFNLDGKPIRHTKTVHGTKAQAKIELAKFVAEVEQGTVIEGKSITFKEFTEIWKRDYGSKELAPSTYRRYLGMLESRILPYLGHFKLDKIKPTDIMKFYDMLDKDTQIRRIKRNNGYRTLKPLSQKTILEHHRLIRAMLHKAVYWQLLFNNPCERVQPPRSRKPKRRYYDDEQCKVLLSNLNELSTENIKYKVAITLTVFTGVRLGELMGLEWSDIDFTNGIVSINKSSQYLADKGVFTKTPKTESSIRDVAIPDFVVCLLKEYKSWYEEQKSIYGDSKSAAKKPHSSAISIGISSFPSLTVTVFAFGIYACIRSPSSVGCAPRRRPGSLASEYTSSSIPAQSIKSYSFFSIAQTSGTII